MIKRAMHAVPPMQMAGRGGRPAVADAAPGGDMVVRRDERGCGEVVNVSPRA